MKKLTCGDVAHTVFVIYPEGLLDNQDLVQSTDPSHLISLCLESCLEIKET